MCPIKALLHFHACAAQSRNLRWARTASRRYSERPAVTEISKVSRLYDGCNKGTVNIQQDLSHWLTMYHVHGYHPWDHSATLRLTQTRERKPVQDVQRWLMWRNRYSSGGTTVSRSLVVEKCPLSILIWQHMAIILQKRRRQALFPCGLRCVQG